MTTTTSTRDCSFRAHMVCVSPAQAPQKATRTELNGKRITNSQRKRHNVPSNHIDYRSQNGPCLSLLWSEEDYHGQSLYLGGEEGLDGNIYCIPGNANRVLCIDPRTDRVYPIGHVSTTAAAAAEVASQRLIPKQQEQQQKPQLLLGKFKWLRGIRVEHIIYGLPCHSPTVLRIDTRSQQVTLLEIPYESFYSGHANIAHEQRNMEWKYHGGSYSRDEGCIYAIPQSAWHVLRIDTHTDTCTLVPSEPLLGRYKWYGGVVGKDGAIYGIPHNAASVLRIQNNTISLHGDYPDVHKWHGAAVAGDGTIVCVPANADYVLCIEPGSVPTVYEIHDPLSIQTGRHRNDGKYKYLGCTRGSDGHVYCFPSGSEFVLQVNTITRTVANVGPNLVPMERMVQNKWQNGIRTDDVNLPTNDPDVHVTDVDTVASTAKTAADLVEGSYKYTTGIPTLRSSAHRVKFSPKHRDATTDKGTCLPLDICENLVLDYDLNRFDFTSVLVAFLKQCDPAVVGQFSSDRLEDLQIPTISLSRGAYGGSCEQAQGYLSDQLAAFEPFMRLFDEFVVDCILPHLKQQVLNNVSNSLGPTDSSSDPMIFYYQRPPTLRLQPGPARAYVKPHCDSEYGHQEGELNFWLPLTDRALTQVDLHVEPRNATSDPGSLPRDGRDECVPVPVEVGQVLSFHGTSRKHFVNSNTTRFTRVSMDFRVGVEGYFDAAWEMVGTTSDHTRLRVQV
ncbi:hypothetical protein MHU86_19579 [Fragilaria crotonensis]|nr:hypothetical protein MHU86_19579 [Fragilaria crotonensis]